MKKNKSVSGLPTVANLLVKKFKSRNTESNNSQSLTRQSNKSQSIIRYPESSLKSKLKKPAL